MTQSDKQAVMFALRECSLGLQGSVLTALEVAEQRWTKEDTVKYGTLFRDRVIALDPK